MRLILVTVFFLNVSLGYSQRPGKTPIPKKTYVSASKFVSSIVGKEWSKKHVIIDTVEGGLFGRLPIYVPKLPDPKLLQDRAYYSLPLLVVSGIDSFYLADALLIDSLGNFVSANSAQNEHVAEILFGYKLAFTKGLPISYSKATRIGSSHGFSVRPFLTTLPTKTIFVQGKSVLARVRYCWEFFEGSRIKDGHASLRIDAETGKVVGFQYMQPMPFK